MNQRKPRSLADVRTALVSSSTAFSSATCESVIYGLKEAVQYHAYSIWLFTFSDLKTIILPSTAFAILHRAGAQAFGWTRTEDDLMFVFARVTLVVAWSWINLLPFTIDNQRRKASIEEDKRNKPWRTLVTGRMTPTQATTLMLVFYPLAILYSLYMGGLKQSLTLIGLGIWYNDLCGSDSCWLVRNVINAAGFVCFTSGALQVLIQRPVFSSAISSQWFLTIGCIVFSTVQTQDMYDQVGDAERGRKTVPLVLGDSLARWSIAVPMLLWSYFCPRFWALPAHGYILPAGLGGLIAYRSLKKRTVKADKATFLLWNLWLVLIYSLPLMQTLFRYYND